MLWTPRCGTVHGEGLLTKSARAYLRDMPRLILRARLSAGKLPGEKLVMHWLGDKISDARVAAARAGLSVLY